MKFSFSTLLVIGVGLLGGCSSRHELSQNANKITVKGVVSLSASWVKHKGKKFDIGFNIANESPGAIIILLNEMKCFRGTLQGELKHTFFNTGERTIDFKTGQMKSFRLVCNVHEEATGDIRMTVSKIYENPGSDGKTRGKVLAENAEWKLPAAAIE